MDQAKLRRATKATVVAELVHAGSDTAVDAVTVTPLVTDDHIVIALPYGRRELADRLASADHATLVLSDDRMALRGWEALAITGRFEVEPDRDGARFSDGLLEQELRKHPPSRALTDSLRDRRDNWWYVARLLCHLIPTGDVQEVAPRSDPTTGVLAWRTTDGLVVETVAVTDADDDSVTVRSLSDRAIRGAGEPALLYRHDYSQPDLERRCERLEAGRLDGSVLREVDRRGELALPDPPGMLERLRRHRQFSKACRRELARVR